MKCFIVVGEASGDFLGAGLISALRELDPSIEIEGIAGPLMEAAGCKKFAASETLSVMGFVEVFWNLKKIFSLRKKLLNYLLSHPPDVYVGIDAPDFNLPIEKKLRQAGIKTVHYHSPSVWAWRPGRIHHIAQATDLMLTLFPFETKIYEENGIPVKYVGHPLADKIPLVPSKSAREHKVVALLPGSRASEINRLGEIFLKTAAHCLKKIPTLKFVAPMANKDRLEQFQQKVTHIAPHLPLSLSVGNTHELLAECDLALLASGTATLEAMLFKCPMVVAYRVSAVNYWLAKRLIKVSHIALPNILAGETWVPEFIQEKATPENLSEALLGQFKDTKQQTEMKKCFDALHLTLKQSANVQAAKAIIALSGKMEAV